MPKTNTADIAPAYTYEWSDAEQSSLKRTDSDGKVTWVPTDPANTDYAQFLASGAEALPYVEPPPPKPLTTQEKVDNMLAAFDLTRDEMRVALDVKTSQEESK